MKDHKDQTEFFDELLHILLNVVPNHPDIKLHVSAVICVVDKHKSKNEFAMALSSFSSAEIEMLVRFVERPRGKHHIHEVKRLWETYGSEQAGRLLLEHFYGHNKKELIHNRKLKLSFH